MLEGLVAWVLNTYLGKYVSNLNTDQLSIALLKGAVELENLPLRKDALRGFDLPFEVKAGVIGKITLQIPFYRPHSDPWVICMSQLNLIIGPAPPQEYDEVREREAEREQSKSECEQKGESYWYSVTASVVTRIVENIELKIQGVHLRFEDDFSNPEKPYAFGVCIKNVSAQNCSKEPAQKLIRQKELEIGEFSVYWDTECSMLGDLPSTDVQEMMSKYMQSREHQYIFEPVCASVLVRRNASKEPLRSRNTPRIEGQVQLEPLSLRLSQVQYQQIMAFFKELDRREREMLFWKWRPKHPISGNCRQWWMFAINANLNEIREQRRQGSWDFALHRARDAKLYTSLYFQRLKGVTLSPQEELERIEDEQTLEELQILRDTVYVSFRKHEEIAESLREPMINETPASCPSGSIPKSGSSGMIQYLQSWFPGWGGWYGGSERGPDGQPVSDDLLPGTAQWEILAETDDLFDPLEDSQTLNTFTRRDHLFARLDFILEKAAVTLYHQDKMKPLLNESGVIQLEFSGVKIGVESLPRSESSLLTVKLGGLFLRDLTTQGSIFPVLVSPKPDKVAVAISQPFGQTNCTEMSNLSPPVFEMIYERNPIRSKFERRLEVNTSPLNIIYNPQAIKKVAEFFYKGRVHTSGFGYQSELELRVAEAARRQYNKLKMQTKAEIRQTIDQLLVGEFIENSKHWTMKLDICAPQVIFPDDFQSEDPMLVVVDLGRILLTNSQEDHKTSPKTSQTEGESDEEFQTPLATPPGTPPPEKEVDVKGQERPCDITSLKSTEGAQIVSKNLYEKYTLSFNDLQIMVGHYKDNWKHLQDSEVGPTHVVEKFNVLLQLEQRLRYTSDPQFPGAVLSGTLPDLKVHINLEKMTALRSCLNLKSPDPLILRHEKIFQREDSDWKLQSSDKNLTKSVMTLEQHTREVLVESRLLLVEFNINYMQLGIESGGQYISVLKVFGTKSHFVKRPYDAMVSLTVHGLYLVDTLQTYGSDFDLLVASHKHLSFDVPTGSLRESQPTSPVSPDGKSPELPGLRRDSSDLNFDKASPRGSPLRDQEALIKLEYQFVSSDCPSMNLDRSLQVTSMQVNNLDIILNPETIVELLKFLQQSFPKDENSPTQQLPPLPNGEENEDTYQSTYVQNKELTVEIHRLNLLLLRTVTTGTVLGGEKKGMKIATASVNGTKVNVSMGSRLDVNGSLGCIQLVDLTQEGGRSQFVVSIGSVEDSSSTDGVAFFSIPGMAPSEALSFRFMEKSQGECSLQLQMASLHYNHSAKFLKELSLSANEVEDNFRSMLKTAATKVSTVLATKTAEYSGMVSLFENPYRRSRRQSQCNWTLDPFEEDYFCVPEKEPGLDSFMVKLTLDVSIESPVVSIPRKPGHPELLVGHLGSIRIQNFVTGHDSEGEKLQVEVKDIRLYSVNTSNLILRKGAQLNSSTTSGPSPSHGGNINLNEPQFTRHDFFEYLSRGKAFHILKDATIQLTVEKVPVDENLHFTFSSEEPYQSTGLMKVDGRFVNAVQVCLCKPVYEQVLQTLDNLSFIEDQRVTPSQSPTPPPPTPSSTKLHRFPDLQGGLFARDPPYVGISYSSLSSSLSATLPLQNKSPPLQPPSFTQVRAIFRVSELQVQLSGDLSQGCQGLVSLRFQDLEGDFTKDHPHSVSIQLALHSLLMEDLLEENPESKYKHLMVSRGAPKPSTFSPKEYLSQSCPTTSNVLCAEMPRSLPAQFEEAQNVFQFYQRHPSTPSASSRKSKKDAECPSTPPPSPSRHTPSPHPRPDFDDSLVHINVLMVDRRHPEFKTRYGSIGRSVDVDFNCLDILITLQTWVMILDFFGIGSTANNHAVKVPTTTPQPTPEHSLENSTLNDLGDLYTEIEERVNTKLDLKVHSLSLVLRKKSNELAKASVSKLFTHMEMIDGDLALQGSLGSLSLSDLTTHGDLYRERFTTHGGEALVYDIHKYGEPDPCLQREYDMKVSLQMASVQYVHTQRFQAEVVAFIQHFTQLQDVLGRQRAAIEGQAVRERPQRAPRVLLDIEAGAPVLLIPESSRSKRLIVANLGQLRVRNRFLPAGTRGTFSLRDKVEKLTMAHTFFPSLVSPTITIYTLHHHSAPVGYHVCLLDCIALDLQEMDIFAAERLPCEPCDSDAKHLETDLIFPSYAVRRSGERLLKERCYLKLKVERNLDKELSHAVPDMSIHGSLSSVHCSLDLERYQLIRGLLEHNLGEPVEEFLRPYNLQDPIILQTVLSGDVYTSLSLLVDMKDVSLELLDNPKSTGHNHSLARFDFMKSKLLFESFSNSSKSVNLVSHSLLAHDTRFTGSSGPTEGKRNVFDCILQPSRTGANRASLQLELHYRSTRDSSCFTVVLNNLRVFLIFDWLQLVRDFLHMPAEKGAAPTHQRWPSGSSDQGGTGAVMPRTVKSGVVTKRSTVPVTQDKYLEVKINVTGTEFVVVEDSSCLDTNAIILKGTTVLTYKPQLLDRPFSGSLAGIEVFSCRLGSEQETALSIIDPVNIQMELCGSPTYQSSSGLLDAFNIEDFPPLLEIQFPALDIRLSYNDVLLFLAIAKSIPTTGSTGPSDTATEAEISASTASTDTPSKSKDSFNFLKYFILEGQLKRLQDLGFKREDCRRALIHCKGQLDQAATWLLENAESMSGRSRTDSDSSSHSAPPLSGVEVKAESVCICFIDDCLDCDVPLAELTFSRLYVLQRIGSIKEGKASFTLSGDYYNRELSGWEPFIEPWPCFLDWQRQAAGRLHPPRLKIGVRAKQRLDVNITSVLLEQYSTTKTSWLADYCKEDEQSPQSSAALSWMGSSVDPPSFGQSLPLAYLRTRSSTSLTCLEQQIHARADMKLSKRRQPFVPYALRNHTGCTMLFATLTTTPTRVALSHSSSADSISDVHGPGTDDTHNISQWREVLPGEEIPFEFEAREKLRHRSCDVTKITVLLDLDPGGTKQIYRQPGHTIYLLPTLVLANLLPCDLNYYIKGTSIKGTMKPGKEAVLHAADTSQNLELGVLLENFPMCKELLIPPGTQNYVVRMRLYDVNKRLICLTIRIVLRAHGALKILISASYWLVNKTGLPLIFRQDNGKTDAAGQFEEHELARSLSPLLFCYTDKEQPNMCTMRIGKGIHPDGVPGWCQGFSLDGGSGVRAVKVIQHGNRPGLIYNIGINVRKGKGRYRDTHIVTFAPRYLLDNRSSHKLAFSQREFVRGKGTANPEGYISTLPGSSVVFHWPRNDYDQLLCVRLMDVPNYTWSGGFEVNKPKSFHINMRDTLGNCFFLRAEIALKGATYQISFSDTDQLPPPFRIDNISEVPIQFWQHGVADIRLHTEVKPGAVLDYACDEPIFQPYITLTVKGAGSSEVTADMNFFREYNKLYYENFIYIAASFTFSEKRVVSCAELVLDVETKTQRVILKKKEPGKRSQLWRMTGTGMLCHEGSSPPQSKPSQPRPLSSSLVLDIAGLAAVTDNSYEPLMLRRPDCRRSTTQTWHFSSGMLTCGLPRLVVQVRGGVSGLYDGAEVVLGPDSGVLEPLPEQQFINQKMRPGSGVLSIQVLPDGPTRVLQISDFNQRRVNRPSPSTEEDQNKESAQKKVPEEELEVLVNLEEGVGLSLVNKLPEELVFATLSGIDVHFIRTTASQVLELTVKDIQVDNQLLGTTHPVMLCVAPSSSESSAVDSGPALQVNSVKVPSSLMLTDLYKHLMVTARRYTVIIEEKLLMKLLIFFGYGQAEGEVEKLDENLYEKTNDDAGTPKRYYFENLKISLPQVKLSVFTSHKLPPDLKALKGALGFPLIRFEDAIINMYPYTRVHPYETQEMIISDILKHFKEELISQAAQILGSVDFLGNPMGLLNDVTEGMNELIKYGNVGGLIRSVTHGVSNSAAKFAGTLSDGLGKTMDNRHQTERECIRYHGATSGEHLVAGIHGLAHGIIGGLTSVITSTVEGVKTEGGVGGFFSGLGKGLVGTVTKPVAGALDFASETAQTVRDMASLSNRYFLFSTMYSVAIPGPSHQKPMVHVNSESLAIKISQEINYAKSLYYEQQLMLPPSENEDSLLLDS
uniref:Vacuolar protein sorting 13 homolog D n=1 Tax=Sinocyclocheilus grahami TaxID=75366 RepID=A0A672LEB6_SINGR